MARYIVPDTCAIAAALFNEPLSARAEPLLRAIRAQTIDAVAPSLMLWEFLNVCRKKREGSSALASNVVQAAVKDFFALPILYVELEPLAPAAWSIYQPGGVETGDAFFVAVARQWEAEIWTTDGRFARAAVAGGVFSAIHDLAVTPFC